MPKIKSKFLCKDMLNFKNELRDIISKCKKTEVMNPYDISQIPRTKLNSTYFVEITNIANLNDEACPLELEVDFSITCWYCGGRNEHNTRDVALGDFGEIIRLFANPKQAYTYNTPGVMGVFPQDVDIEPYSSDDENTTQARYNFTARVCLDLTKEV